MKLLSMWVLIWLTSCPQTQVVCKSRNFRKKQGTSQAALTHHVMQQWLNLALQSVQFLPAHELVKLARSAGTGKHATNVPEHPASLVALHLQLG